MFTLVILLLCVATAPVLAMGGREEQLPYVDRLIADQRYDEAIIYLKNYIQENPEMFDAAQSRIQRIIKIRAAYNKSAATLIDVLQNDPTNQERKLALIRELESYERTPNAAIREFVAKTKELALFTFNRAKFEDIMIKAQTLIDGRLFTDAAFLYETGFSLYKPEFEESEYDPALVRDAFERVARVSGGILLFAYQSTVMEDAFSALGAALAADDVQATDRAWNHARLAAQGFSALRRDIVDQGRALEALFLDIVANDSTVTENSFLPFAFRLILGRKAEDSLEGVVGAMDALWTSALGQAQVALDRKLESEALAARAAFDSGSWAEAELRYLSLEARADRGAGLLLLWNPYITSDLFERSTALGRAALQLKGNEYLNYLHLSANARSYAALAAVQLQVDETAEALASYRPASGDDSYIPAYEKLRMAFGNASTLMEGLGGQSMDLGARLAVWTRAGYAPAPTGIRQTALDSSIQSAIRRSKDLETRAVASAAAWSYGLLATVAEAAAGSITQGKGFLDGTVTADSRPSTALSRYPQLALGAFATAGARLRTLLPEAEDFLRDMNSLPAFLRDAPAVRDWIARGSSLVLTAQVGMAEVDALMARAREQKRLADLNKAEADRLVNEVRVAVRSNNFPAAKRLLDIARDRYATSLSLEQNVSLRREIDTVITELGATVGRAENHLVVSDTRRFLTGGKNFYRQGQFEQAESAILQARSRWSSIYTAPDVEIEYWLGLAQTALSVRTARDIPVTSPLFPEMNRILSLARRHYNEGAAALARRDRIEALKSFALAMELIAQVKAAFPLSQDASVLELRIDQLVDPDEFRRKFARMLGESKAMVEAGINIPTVYNTLKDLEAIDPRYVGLRPLLDQAETLMGFRQATPDPRDIAEALNLVNLAQAIFDSGRVEEFPHAMIQVSKALSLHPDSEAASILKDKIATFIISYSPRLP